MTDKVIYVRIGKCAGTSLKRYFKGMGLYCRVGKRQFNSSNRFIDFYNDPIEKNLDNIRRLGDIWQSSFKFTIVRNPFSRLVSGYEYCRKHGARSSPNTQIDFKTFVRQLDEAKLNAFEEKHIGRLQTDHCIQECNRIIKIEHLNEEFGSLCEEMGIENRGLAVRNANRYTQSPLDYFDAETLQVARTLFQPDFDVFGYEKGELA